MYNCLIASDNKERKNDCILDLKAQTKKKNSGEVGVGTAIAFYFCLCILFSQSSSLPERLLEKSEKWEQRQHKTQSETEKCIIAQKAKSCDGNVLSKRETSQTSSYYGRVTTFFTCLLWVSINYSDDSILAAQTSETNGKPEKNDIIHRNPFSPDLFFFLFASLSFWAHDSSSSFSL